MVDRREIMAIAAGGFLGAILRAEASNLWMHDPGSWPWGTFIINIAGAALLGYFVTRLQERLPLSAYRRPLLGTGLCGALTTFSTMQLETLTMLDVGHVGLAFRYLGASVICGLVAVYVTTHLTRRSKVTA